MSQIAIRVSIASRDEISLKIECDEHGRISSSQVTGVGCLELLTLLKEWRPKFSGVLLGDVPLPTGISHAAMLLREAILRAQNRWAFPYDEPELCHCRAISTERVDNAIVGGCHTVAAIRAATSANTSCGTCLPDVKKVLAYRLAQG